MSLKEALENNPFDLSLNFIMEYTPDNKNIVDKETHQNLKKLFVDYLNQQQELARIKEDFAVAEDEITKLVHEHSKCLGDNESKLFDLQNAGFDAKIDRIHQIIELISNNQNHHKTELNGVLYGENKDKKICPRFDELQETIETLKQTVMTIETQNRELVKHIEISDHKLEGNLETITDLEKHIEILFSEKNQISSENEEELTDLKTSLAEFKRIYYISVKDAKIAEKDISHKKTLIETIQILERNNECLSEENTKLSDRNTKINNLLNQRERQISLFSKREMLLNMQVKSANQQVQKEKENASSLLKQVEMRLEQKQKEADELRSEVNYLQTRISLSHSMQNNNPDNTDWNSINNFQVSGMSALRRSDRTAMSRVEIESQLNDFYSGQEIREDYILESIVLKEQTSLDNSLIDEVIESGGMLADKGRCGDNGVVRELECRVKDLTSLNETLRERAKTANTGQKGLRKEIDKLVEIKDRLEKQAENHVVMILELNSDLDRVFREFRALQRQLRLLERDK